VDSNATGGVALLIGSEKLMEGEQDEGRIEGLVVGELIDLTMNASSNQSRLKLEVRIKL
jgi:hypothetical protein